MNKGFTLIELIVVIAVIAVLAVIIAPSAFNTIKKGRESALLGDFDTIKTGSMGYFADVSAWPANNISDGTGFVTNSGSSDWAGPYIDKWPGTNPWGGTYTWYRNTGGFDADANEERYVAVTNVPIAGARNLDNKIDGTLSGTAGYCRFNNSATDTTTVNMLVTED